MPRETTRILEFWFTTLVWLVLRNSYQLLHILFLFHDRTIRIWMNCSTGEKPVEETVREIHAECEAMTNRSPGASFRLVTSPLLTKSFRIYPINHIEVNISPFGMGEQGKLNDGMKQNEPSYSTDDSRPVAPTTSAVTSDYQQLDVV